MVRHLVAASTLLVLRVHACADVDGFTSLSASYRMIDTGRLQLGRAGAV